MTKANKLRELFPNYIGTPSIDVYEDDESAKTVTYLDVPNNRIEVLWSNFDYSSGEWHGDVEGTTLDDTTDGVNDFDDKEFDLLVKGLKL